MKILHLGRFYDDTFGGVERHVIDLLDGLSEHVTVANLVCPKNVRFRTQVLKHGNWTVYKAGGFGLFASTVMSPMFPLLLFRLQFRHKFDIIHLHLPDPLSVFSALLLPRKIPLVVTWHSDVVKQKRLVKLIQPFINALLRRASAVIAATPAHFDSSTQIESAHPSKRYVIPYGININTFKLTPAVEEKIRSIREKHAGEKIVFAIGRHVYYKGFEFLLQSMEHIDAHLILGGTGPLTESLREYAQTPHLKGKITFEGRLNEDDLILHYHACDVFCLPSIEQSEAFGLVQIEAMSCHKPVVCCELNNGVTFVNQDGVTGLVVPPRDPKALAGALDKILSDETLAKKLGEAGYRRVLENFTVERKVERTLALYRSILEQ